MRTPALGMESGPAHTAQHMIELYGLEGFAAALRAGYYQAVEMMGVMYYFPVARPSLPSRPDDGGDDDAPTEPPPPQPPATYSCSSSSSNSDGGIKRAPAPKMKTIKKKPSAKRPAGGGKGGGGDKDGGGGKGGGGRKGGGCGKSSTAVTVA